jgi:hypothetical protein
LGTITNSFTNFYSNFDNYSSDVTGNFTTLTSELLTTITSVNSLSKRLTASATESQTSINSVSNTITILSTQVNKIEKGFEMYKNRTMQKFEIFDKEVEEMSAVMINRTTMEILMGQISQEISTSGLTASKNISGLAAEMAVMGMAMQNRSKKSQEHLIICEIMLTGSHQKLDEVHIAVL